MNPPRTPEKPPRYAIVIPVCDEEECLGDVLDELARQLPENRDLTIAVGLNDVSDRSGEIARSRENVVVGETAVRGYGDGCMAATEAVLAAGIEVDAWIFFAGDGASDPADLGPLIAAFEGGAEFVHGTRTTSLRNWRRPWRRIAANVVLGLWTSALTGELFLDLGPYRVIGRELFERMNQRELGWGWTIESQILAARLGAKIAHVPVGERNRIAGRQKVSGVSLPQTLKIGFEIARAGWRVASRRLTKSSG